MTWDPDRADDPLFTASTEDLIETLQSRFKSTVILTLRDQTTPEEIVEEIGIRFSGGFIRAVGLLERGRISFRRRMDEAE